MGLLDLPPEILDSIIELTLPAGFEAFALSCKAVYIRASAHLIAHHNTLKHQWQYTTISSPSRGSALRMLSAISREPLISEYVELLGLWHTGGPRLRDQPTEEPFDFGTDEVSIDSTKELVVGSEILRDVGIASDEWWDHVVDEDPQWQAAFVSLLLILPELKTLRLPSSWGERTREEDLDAGIPMWNVLDHVLTRAVYGGQALANLETLLPFRSTRQDDWAALSSIDVFMSLPAMKEMLLVSLVAAEDDLDTSFTFSWRFPNLYSALQRIELAYCCIDAENLLHLLVHTPNLDTFRYSHQTKDDGIQHDWNPGAFIEAIGRYCGPSIRSLAVTIDDLSGHIINGASSFHHFPNLHHIEIDVRIFCGPPLESGQYRGSQTSFIPDGERAWVESDLPCLGSMLAVDIREVHINTEFPEPDAVALRALLKNFKAQRKERLRSIHTAVVHQFEYGTARPLIEEVGGVTLDVFRPPPGSGWGRDMMPAWKRDFEARVGGWISNN